MRWYSSPGGIAVALASCYVRRASLVGVLGSLSMAAIGVFTLGYSLWLGTAIGLTGASLLWVVRRATTEYAQIGAEEGPIAIEADQEEGLPSEVRAFVTRIATTANTWLVRPSVWLARTVAAPAWRTVRRSHVAVQAALVIAIAGGLGIASYELTQESSPATNPIHMATYESLDTLEGERPTTTSSDNDTPTNVDITSRPAVGYVSPRPDNSGTADYLALYPNGQFRLEPARSFDLKGWPESPLVACGTANGLQGVVFGTYTQHGRLITLQPVNDNPFNLQVAGSNAQGVPTQLTIGIAGQTRAFTACELNPLPSMFDSQQRGHFNPLPSMEFNR